MTNLYISAQVNREKLEEELRRQLATLDMEATPERMKRLEEFLGGWIQERIEEWREDLIGAFIDYELDQEEPR